MSAYMTEEEQLEQIRKWWLKHQNVIITCIAIMALIVAGYRYWHWHVEKNTQQASIAYQSMMMASNQHDDKGVQSYANELIRSHEQSVYGSAAHLLLAKLFIDQKAYDQAVPHLAYVASHSNVMALKQLATIRLARVQLSQKKYDDALTALSNIGKSSYAAVINELKGDIYMAKGEFSNAEGAYQLANKNKNISADSPKDLLLEMKQNAAKTMLESQMASKTV